MAPRLMVDERAFPSAPPSDLDDPEVIVGHDWEAFAAVSRMTDHWARQGWPDGGRVYYWMLTFPDCAALVSRAQQCQHALAHPGMDPVPADGLHVTMARIGDTAHVPAARIHHLVALAERLALKSFSVLAHPLAGSRGAVRFTLTPWTPLVRLHAELSAHTRQAGVPGGMPTAAFRPHLGIQYSNRDQLAAPVIEGVAQLRCLPPVPRDITSVDLVELYRTDLPRRSCQWEVLHRFFLGRPSK
ncbi:2'-5' RNA ligase family protein [Streptomyces sp. NPDC088246]|uniref:2'-5' RNA ligase family protein n=1 Tax=Streptomyces sp. NPDC088246 TaxID=3365842 RepID=UPI00382E1916